VARGKWVAFVGGTPERAVACRISRTGCRQEAAYSARSITNGPSSFALRAWPPTCSLTGFRCPTSERSCSVTPGGRRRPRAGSGISARRAASSCGYGVTHRLCLCENPRGACRPTSRVARGSVERAQRRDELVASSARARFRDSGFRSARRGRLAVWPRAAAAAPRRAGVLGAERVSTHGCRVGRVLVRPRPRYLLTVPVDVEARAGPRRVAVGGFGGSDGRGRGSRSRTGFRGRASMHRRYVPGELRLYWMFRRGQVPEESVTRSCRPFEIAE